MVARVRDVVWATSARDALDAVVEYIAQDSRQVAGQVLDDALDAGASLASFAERGRVVPELNDAAIREVFVHSEGSPSAERSRSRKASAQENGFGQARVLRVATPPAQQGSRQRA